MAIELIDVYDRFMRWTGERLPKDELHAQGKLHICVHCVITNGNCEVLAQFRGKVGHMPEVWDAMSIAGHITALTDEERADPAMWDVLWQAWRAAQREGQEELGVELPDNMLLGDDCRLVGVTLVDQLTVAGWRDHAFCINFMVRLPELEISQLKLEVPKVTAAKWVHVSDIEAWLESREGAPYATRMPDDYELLQSVVDTARRMLIVEQDDE